MEVVKHHHPESGILGGVVNVGFPSTPCNVCVKAIPKWYFCIPLWDFMQDNCSYKTTRKMTMHVGYFNIHL